MHPRVAACAVLLGLTAPACVHMGGPIFEKYTYPKETAVAHVVQVFVRDTRKGLSPDSFDTPTFSTPADGETRRVPITRATADEMGRRLARLIPGGGEPLIVDIEITDGSASWESSWSEETARARAKLEVTFRNARTNVVLLKTSGEAWGEHGSADVHDEEPGALFQASVLAAFDRAVATQATVHALSARLPLATNALPTTGP